MPPTGSADSTILGLYGGIRCGVLAGFSREQLRQLFEQTFDSYLQAMPDEDRDALAKRASVLAHVDELGLQIVPGPIKHP
jgi:hypothetical protein